MRSSGAWPMALLSLLGIGACNAIIGNEDIKYFTTTDPDGGTSAGDAGSDSPSADDAATSDLVTSDIVEPWHLAVAGGDLVVTSHAPVGGGVFRVPKSGGRAVQIALRPAYAVAVRGTNDIWYCNREDAGGPGLFEVPIDGGMSQEQTNVPCRGIAVEPTGDIAYTTSANAFRLADGGGGGIFLGADGGPEGIAADTVGVYFAQFAANKIGRWKNGAGGGDFTATGPGPTRVRAEGNYVYWVESGTDKVQRRGNDTNTGNEVVATGPGNTAEGGLAIDETHVYWVVARGPNAGLYRMAKTGGTRETIKTGLTFPVDVALDDNYAYVTVHGENKVLRFPKNK